MKKYLSRKYFFYAVLPVLPYMLVFVIRVSFIDDFDEGSARQYIYDSFSTIWVDMFVAALLLCVGAFVSGNARAKSVQVFTPIIVALGCFVGSGFLHQGLPKLGWDIEFPWWPVILSSIGLVFTSLWLADETD